jgi:hypothetical protein
MIKIGKNIALSFFFFGSILDERLTKYLKEMLTINSWSTSVIGDCLLEPCTVLYVT